MCSSDLGFRNGFRDGFDDGLGDGFRWRRRQALRCHLEIHALTQRRQARQQELFVRHGRRRECRGSRHLLHGCGDRGQQLSPVLVETEAVVVQLAQVEVQGLGQANAGRSGNGTKS